MEIDLSIKSEEKKEHRKILGNISPLKYNLIRKKSKSIQDDVLNNNFDKEKAFMEQYNNSEKKLNLTRVPREPKRRSGFVISITKTTLQNNDLAKNGYIKDKSPRRSISQDRSKSQERKISRSKTTK